MRDLPEPAVLWRREETILFDYGAGTGGIPVLFVPSLINRGSILDLTEERSMLRWLARREVRPMLLEWGWPGSIERRFTMTDYIAERLEPAMAAAAAQVGGRIVLMGYCMGGLFCIAAAVRNPDLVEALGLIATPWDFHAAGIEAARAVAGLGRLYTDAIARTGTLPIDAIQLAFAGMDPQSIVRKFVRFGGMAQDGEDARLFVAIEDWLNDGVPLAGLVAQECLEGWYEENRPARGHWRIGDAVIDPASLDMPTLLAIPQRDRIVPPQSARALASRLRGVSALELPGGHVSIVAGPRAPELLWAPMLEWLRRSGS